MGGWPFPGDTAVDIARKVAQAYRTALRLNNRDLCNQLDATMAEVGQGWVIPPEVRHEATDALTTTEAAAAVSVSVATIRQWACQPHPTQPGRALLPRYAWRGRERTYLVVHVLEAARLAQVMPVRQTPKGAPPAPSPAIPGQRSA